jgi:geranylgeranyl pyrophosphate synthase
METTRSDFSELVASELYTVEELMRERIVEIHPNLEYAVNHLLAAGGKRIRPTLTLLAGRLLEADMDKTISLAAAIEMLHTATLVHDDLIDGATTRRGKPTLNTQWPTGATVLTGDYVFARAARLAADTGSVELMKLFAQKLMVMVNGEITQIFGDNPNDLRKNYFERIYAKTASLFEIASSGPAFLCNCDETIQSKMRAFGYEVGIAFQIVDDVLDFMGDEDLIGKPVASDLRHGLITLPSLRYFETNPNDKGLLEILDRVEIDDDVIESVLANIRDSGALQGAMDEAKEFIMSAKNRLNGIKVSSNQEALIGLADYIVDRSF